MKAFRQEASCRPSARQEIADGKLKWLSQCWLRSDRRLLSTDFCLHCPNIFATEGVLKWALPHTGILARNGAGLVLFSRRIYLWEGTLLFVTLLGPVHAP